MLEFLNATPEDSFLQHALALEYIKLGKDPDAKLLFEKILDREPAYIASYYQLGQLLEREGQVASAIDCYQKGMTVAKIVGNNKAFHELRAAWEELAGD